MLYLISARAAHGELGGATPPGCVREGTLKMYTLRECLWLQNPYVYASFFYLIVFYQHLEADRQLVLTARQLFLMPKARGVRSPAQLGPVLRQ